MAGTRRVAKTKAGITTGRYLELKKEKTSPTTKLVPLLHPAGGLVYHARAARLAGGKWTDFRASIGHWLTEWQPAVKGLLLVGPSAGYTIPSAWLSQFDEVVAIDFDPLAKRIFQARHRECRVTQWIGEDIFPVTAQGIDWKPLKIRLRQFPNHAVLFSNVLGQIAMSSPHEEAVERSLAHLPEILHDRAWASYHDRLSAPYRPVLPSQAVHQSDFELACDAFREGGEVVSHSTGLLGQSLACETFAWECRKDYWHLIEACCSS